MATRDRVQPTVGVTADGFVSLGVISRAHGVRGGLRIHFWNEDSTVLHEGMKVRLRSEKRTRDAEISKIYGPALVHIAGIDDKNAADLMQGYEVLVPRDAFPELEGEGYLVDLIGARVIDEAGAPVGLLEGFTDNVAQPLACVKTAAGKEVLVPFVDGIVVRVEDDDQGKPVVVVALPDGLLTLGDEDDAADGAENDDEPEESTDGPPEKSSP
jgi:16S rRNA processing protein RimM